MRFRGRRAYLTGATGFIGRVVARRLVEEGAEVTALVRPSSDTRFLEQLGVTLQKGNVRDKRSLQPDGADVLIHMAAWVGFGVPRKKKDLFFKTNVQGTKNALDAAERAGVPKVVHVSSVAALGVTGERPVTEAYKRPDGYVSEYERAKTEAHRLALDSGLDVALPMPGLVLGPGSEFDLFFRLFARGRLPFLPKSSALKGWVHVEDCAEGILLCALKGRGPYLLVDDNVNVAELFYRLRHLADVPAPRLLLPPWVIRSAVGSVESWYHLWGKTPIMSREHVRSMYEPMAYDSSRARRELGWHPDLWGRLADDVRALKAKPKAKKR